MLSMTRSMIIYLTSISIIVGAVLQINLIGSRAFLVSNLDPIFAVYTGIIAGVLSTIFFRFLTTPKYKYAYLSFSLMTAQSLIYAILYFAVIPAKTLAVLWITFAAFSIGICKWITSEMANKYLDPARAQSFFSYLTSFLGIGFIISFVVFKIFRISLSPKETLLVTSVLFAIITLLIVIGFFPKHVLENNFEKSTSSDQKEIKIKTNEIDSLKKSFSILCFIIGGSNIIFTYLINIQIKANLQNFEEINKLINDYTLISSILILIAGFGLGQVIKRKRTSPITILLISNLILLLLSTAALLTNKFELFIALEVTQKFIGQSLIASSMQQIINSFIDMHKNLFISLQQFFYFTFTTPLLATIFYFSKSLSSDNEVLFLGSLLLAFLVSSFIFINKFKTSYKAVLISYMRSDFFGAKVLASQMLSFLRPNNFIELMKSELEKNQKNYIRKTIIIGLGYSPENSTTEIIKNEFNSDKEEVQIAVLEALSTQERIEGVSFLMDILSMKVLPKSFLVRLNATKLIAKLYDTKAIPIIIEGLNDPDDRVVANVLETLSTFKNKDLIKYFIKFSQHKNNRVKANALMGCYQYKETKTIYLETVRDALKSQDYDFLPSVFYIIGALKDNTFIDELKIIANDIQKIPENNIAPLSFALISNNQKTGFKLALKCFKNESQPNIEIPFTHFLSQLNKVKRFDFIRNSAKDTTISKNILGHLKNSRFDFYEEAKYLELLFR